MEGVRSQYPDGHAARCPIRSPILTSDLDLALPSPKLSSEHDLTELSKSDHVETYVLLSLSIVMEKGNMGTDHL